jgi:hypothetical protein
MAIRVFICYAVPPGQQSESYLTAVEAYVREQYPDTELSFFTIEQGSSTHALERIARYLTEGLLAADWVVFAGPTGRDIAKRAVYCAARAFAYPIVTYRRPGGLRRGRRAV